MLEEFLKDPDPDVQEEAVDTIAGIEDTSSLETLMELAQSHAEHRRPPGSDRGAGRPLADTTRAAER